MVTYKGFSTLNPLSKNFTLTDVNLINQDLLNQFNVRTGSRVMQPGLGCLAWDLLFEPMTASQQSDLVANITQIVATDPRVQLQTINVTASENSITVTLKLYYVQLNVVNQMTAMFTQDANNAVFV